MRAAVVTMFTIFAGAPAVVAQPRVEITAVIQGEIAPSAPQQWNQLLAKAGCDRATIRSMRVSDELGIANAGGERNPVYRVTAILSGDTLVLPPRSRFSRRDVGGITKWIRDLKENGPEVVTSAKTAFGLTPKQLEAVNDDLKMPVSVSTKGAASADVVKQLARGLRHAVTIDAGAQRALASDDAIRDELRGLSTGTALAAILRPAGLVLHPRTKAGRVELAVVDSRQRLANWPIGWDSKQSPGKAIPSLFDSEETQEVEVPLNVALDELSKRIRTPVLMDHNGMAVRRIAAEAPVTMRAGRSHFGSIFSHLLRQVGMQYEVRVDENNKPFLWLSAGR